MNKITTLAISALIAIGFVSCSTTYDAAGNPVQSVDPGAAAVGVIGAGLLGAVIANNNKGSRNYRRNKAINRQYYRGGHYYHHNGYHHNHYGHRHYR